MRKAKLRYRGVLITKSQFVTLAALRPVLYKLVVVFSDPVTYLGYYRGVLKLMMTVWMLEAGEGTCQSRVVYADVNFESHMQ